MPVDLRLLEPCMDQLQDLSEQHREWHERHEALREGARLRRSNGFLHF